jgi:hypothetical protein
MKRIRSMLRAVLRGTPAFAVLVLVHNVARAEDASSGMPGDWLSRYASARSIGLGGAFVAAADDPLATVWNPAGLTQSLQNEVHFETARYFEDTSINTLSFVMPARRLPTLGFTMLSMSSGGFERTDELNTSLGTFDNKDMAFLISASKSLTQKFSVGANLKIVNQQVEDFKSSGVGADVGVLYTVVPRVKLGLSMLNLGGPSLSPRDVSETYPMEVRGGVAVAYMHGKGLLSVEADHRDGPGTTFHAGTEVWFMDQFGLRAGYNDTEGRGRLQLPAQSAGAIRLRHERPRARSRALRRRVVPLRRLLRQLVRDTGSVLPHRRELGDENQHQVAHQSGDQDMAARRDRQA